MKVRETRERPGGMGGGSHSETRVIELPEDTEPTAAQLPVDDETPLSDWQPA